MKTNSIWVWTTIAAIWVAVLTMSMGSPELQFGDEPEIVDVAAIVDWFWGLIATVGVLRLTLFRRPSEVGWGQDTAWPWILVVVGGIWLAAAVASISLPVLELGDNIVVPVAAIIAPVGAAMLTWYACEFLISGFAARRGADPA
ncbi:MAG: hypothetical protein U9N84_13005 [Actinomycetota bacterium]|nr:hypothetical protein [Actinomycetota bacterium]